MNGSTAIKQIIQNISKLGYTRILVEGGAKLSASLLNENLIDEITWFRASKIMQDRVLNHQQIEVVWNKTVEKINGDASVSSIELKDVENETTSELKLDGVFVAIGHDPNVKFLDELVELDEKGYIKTGFTTETSTSVPGVFAAGDVADSLYRQAITAAGTGCQAAMDVERWLDH